MPRRMFRLRTGGTHNPPRAVFSGPAWPLGRICNASVAPVVAGSLMAGERAGVKFRAESLEVPDF